MADDALWQYENDPDVTRKTCAHCSGPMWKDGTAAIKYDGLVYHDYCLIDMLTQFHHANCLKSDGLAVTSEETAMWGLYGARP